MVRVPVRVQSVGCTRALQIQDYSSHFETMCKLITNSSCFISCVHWLSRMNI